MIKPDVKNILFTSGKGGVGKSTLSTTYAKLLTASGKKVLMIDFDVSLRTLDIMLGVSSIVLYDWYDVVAGNCTPEAAVIKTAGPDLLAAPQGNVTFDKEDIIKLLSYYESSYDNIILDCPAGVGEILNVILSVTQLAIIVSTPDAVCVRSASVAAEFASAASVESRLVINRFKKKVTNNMRALTVDDVIDATETQLIGVVPEDMQLSLALLNGELIDVTSKAVKAMDRIMRRINGEYVPLKI